jgi:hypothetical protein
VANVALFRLDKSSFLVADCGVLFTALGVRSGEMTTSSDLLLLGVRVAEVEEVYARHLVKAESNSLRVVEESFWICGMEMESVELVLFINAAWSVSIS